MGEIYKGFVVKRAAKSTITFLFCSANRRIILGSIITFGEGNPLVQFSFIHFSSVLLVALLGLLRPLDSRGAQRLEIGNEFLVLVVFNFLLCHTELT